MLECSSGYLSRTGAAISSLSEPVRRAGPRGKKFFAQRPGQRMTSRQAGGEAVFATTTAWGTAGNQEAGRDHPGQVYRHVRVNAGTPDRAYGAGRASKVPNGRRRATSRHRVSRHGPAEDLRFLCSTSRCPCPPFLGVPHRRSPRCAPNGQTAPGRATQGPTMTNTGTFGPAPPTGTERHRVMKVQAQIYIVGAGIAGLSAAVFAIRDGGVEAGTFISSRS